MLAVLLISTPLAASLYHERKMRSMVVQIVSEHGSCSGEQVRAPSGTDYILTAGHCGVLEKDGSFEVITSEGKHLQRKFIAEDTMSDLILIEGLPHKRGLDIADSVEVPDHIYTYTHGAAMATYKTEGDLIEKKMVGAILYQIDNDEQEAKCTSMKKFQVKEIPIFFGIVTIKACVLNVVEMGSTAMTVPGSSGGMAVDSAGDLIGVVSMGDGTFSFFVTLEDIKSFMSAY